MPNWPFSDIRPSDLSRFAAQGRWDLVRKAALMASRTAASGTMQDVQRQVGGSRSYTPDEDGIWDSYSITFKRNAVTLEEMDEGKAESNSVTFSIKNGQVMVTPGESSMPVPMEEYPDFQGLTPESLASAILKWEKETKAWIDKSYKDQEDIDTSEYFK